MDAQRKRARAAGSFSAKDGISADLIADVAAHRVSGLPTWKRRPAVLAILIDGQPVDKTPPGRCHPRIDAVLRRIRWPGRRYRGIGGRVHASGSATPASWRARFMAMSVKLESGKLKVGEQVSARIDSARVPICVRHHSATHLLHSALRTVLGEHVQQKGSLVAPDRLRFDFSHHEPVSDDEFATIERMVNEQIQANAEAEAREMSFDDAMEPVRWRFSATSTATKCGY
jgi:alanyl-tRNA synthetase